MDRDAKQDPLFWYVVRPCDHQAH